MLIARLGYAVTRQLVDLRFARPVIAGLARSTRPTSHHSEIPMTTFHEFLQTTAPTTRDTRYVEVLA